MLSIVWCLLILTALPVSCASRSGESSSPQPVVPVRQGTLTLDERVIDSAYLGCGVQWDPYDVHDDDGRFSAEDRARLNRRLDYLSPRIVRVMCSIGSYLTGGVFDSTRNMEDLHMILGYCTGHAIPVVFGDWGGGFVDVERKTVDGGRIEQMARMVRYLLEDCGYTCIRYFNMVNEPNGSWSSTQGDCALWLRAARAMADALGRQGLSDRVTLVGPDAAVWTTAETHWVTRTAEELGDAVGMYDIHTYPSKAEINAGEYGRMVAAYRAAAPSGQPMIMGEIGIKFIDERDAAYAAENERRAEACPFASPTDSQMFVFDHMYGVDMANAIMQTAANGYSGCIVWMLDDAMHVNEPGRLKIWGFWNILGEERYGAAMEQIRPWYYAIALLSRYFPTGSRILGSAVGEVAGVRALWGEYDGKPTLAVVNTNPDQAVVLTLDGLTASWSGLDRYLYAEGALQLDGERLLPVERRVTLRSGDRIRIEPESMVVYTALE